MRKRIRHIIGGIKGAFIVLGVFILFPLARLILWRKKIWIVTEYGYEARDNGYSFFKFLRKEHQNINVFYAIDYNSVDLKKVKELGNTLKFGSFKHVAYWCAARCIISSKTQGFCPNYYLSLLRKKFHLWGKYVFLQHGITKDDQKFLYKKKAKIDLFICGAKPEYDDIKAHYGYKDNEIAYTGFARFDEYHNLSLKDEIFVMPTWRRYAENVNFTDTDYFKTWSQFINSKKLNEILQKKNLIMYFYLHPHFKEHINLFSTQCSNIKICSFEQCDIQEMIKDSKMFITDFSSLAFDFGYMKKPVIYYQYDEDKFFSGHYIKGYFDYRTDGFGPACNTFDEFIGKFNNLVESSVVPNDYLNNQRKFFPLYDAKNSSRIYESITKMLKW